MLSPDTVIGERICPGCGDLFSCAGFQRVYCSDACRCRASSRRDAGAVIIFNRRCARCDAPFDTPSPTTLLCSDECRQARERERDAERALDPSRVLAVRARLATWAASHRNCKRTNAWLAGPPPYSSHLPGVTCTVTARPIPKWPIELRNTRGLHGALTTALDVGHHPRFPAFAIRPWDSQWAVHWLHPAGERLVASAVNVPLYDRPSELRFGPPVRFRAPVIAKRGHRRIRLETIMPVVIRTNGGAEHCVRPTADAIRNTIAGEALNRIAPPGVDGWAEYVRERARVETIEIATEPEHIQLGAKYGVVHGWSGRVDLDVNAVSHWLLVAASRIGFGSRIAFGFGWMRVTEIP